MKNLLERKFMQTFWKYTLLLSGIMPSVWGQAIDSTETANTAKSSLYVPDTLELPQANAKARKAITSSNSQIIRDRDLSLRVMTDPSDVIKVTPGLFTGQHAGGGKANQYFIRGFDADHGTDLSLWFDGMPINNISHGHGQGYADLHFIIPELVEQVQVNKGPYAIEYGDLATAGSVSMKTRKRFTENELYVTGGMDNTSRVLSILTLNTPAKPILAAEVFRSDGPFKNPENLERYNLFLKTPITENANSSLDLTLMAYGSGWNGSGQVAQRAIDSGWINRFGSLDPSEGGSSQRQSVSLNYFSAPSVNEEFQATAYLINYRLSLYSDFTFFADDSINGDEINQRDDRTVTGFQATYEHKHNLMGLPAEALFGLASRNDLIHTNLDHAKERKLLNKKVDAETREGSYSTFVKESITPLPWLYLELGLRGDHFSFNVTDKLLETGDSSITGVKDASIFSPKVNVVVTPIPGTDIYFNYGEGFHSNDARGVTTTIDPARPLTKGVGYEVGTRTQLFQRWDLAASLWRLDMDGEFVWVGDGGGTAESFASKRIGVDFETRLQILSWLWADFDMTKCTADYTHNAGNGTAVALAPRLTMAGGLSMRHASGVYGSLRMQHLDDRPADEAGSFIAYGFTVFDLAVGYRYKNWELIATISNLFNTKWYNAQFENDSRIKNPQGVIEAATVTDMHVVPGTPFHLQGGLKLYF